MYGARFRYSGAAAARALLADKGWATVVPGLADWSVTPEALVVGDAVMPRRTDRLGGDLTAALAPWGLSPTRLQMCFAVHAACVRALWSTAFMTTFGFYAVEPQWAALAARQAGNVHDDAGFLRLLLASYLLRIRGADGQRALLAAVQADDECCLEGVGAATAAALVDEFGKALRCIVGTPMPLAITRRVLGMWRHLMYTLQVPYPVLVMGESGCGKSVCVRALGLLLGHTCQQLLMTADTDPSELTGQLNPVAQGAVGGSGAAGTDTGRRTANIVEWCDSVVTVAYVTDGGQWCLMRNLNEADACVVECVNPLLEVPTVWIRSAKGESAPIAAPTPHHFRVIATMSIPAAATLTCKELAPALYNRFQVVVMPNVGADAPEDDAGLEAELAVVARALCGLPVADPETVDVCASLVRLACKLWTTPFGGTLTFRR